MEQNQAVGSSLPESDREDMGVFLPRVRQLLPVLGSELLAPIAAAEAKAQTGGPFVCRIKRAEARGQCTPNGFVVFSGSTAVLTKSPSAQQRHHVCDPASGIDHSRQNPAGEGSSPHLHEELRVLQPRAAAAVVHGDGASGLTEWKTTDGVRLRELDERS